LYAVIDPVTLHGPAEDTTLRFPRGFALNLSIVSRTTVMSNITFRLVQGPMGHERKIDYLLVDMLGQNP
jgi:hypothetical protein